jgi:hypothetical protein
MKKLALVFLLALGSAFAADIPRVLDSAKPIIGAVGDGSPYYIPGYGLSITKTDLGRNFDLELTIRQLSQIVSSLASLVEGLEPDDYVSVSLTVFGFDMETVYLTVRVKPGQADSLEVWVNGAKR